MSFLKRINSQKLGSIQTAETMYTRLPEDLQEKMTKAVDQMLDIGNGDNIRGQTITNWSKEAINLYRLMGINEAEIRKKVGSRLENFLQAGRRQKLPSNINKLPLFNEKESETTIIAAEDFQSKYDLNHFRNIKSLLGNFEETTHYGISLEAAFDLAAEIEDGEKAKEICSDMIRLNNIEAAYKTAEKLGDDETLINLGKLALVDFFDQYSPYGIHNATNKLWHAIESLKRVQGKLKPIAAEMLYDLAKEISSEEFIQEYINNARTDEPDELRDRILESSLKALRSTGTLIERLPIDSVKVDFITRVEDKRHAKEIRDLAHRIMETADRPDLSGVREALHAIGDTDSLHTYAKKIFEERHNNSERCNPIRFYSHAIAFFRAAGDNKAIKEVIDAAMNEGILNLNENDYEYNLVPTMVKIDYKEGLNRVNLISKEMIKNAKEKYLKNAWQRIAEKTERALKNQPLEEIDKDKALIQEDKTLPNYIHNARAEERSYRESLEKSRNILTPETKQRLIAQGAELLKQGDEWNAYICFKDALHRQGLIQAGDMMLKKGNGLNAKIPYVFASLLSQEDTLLPGGIEEKLIEKDEK